MERRERRSKHRRFFGCVPFSKQYLRSFGSGRRSGNVKFWCQMGLDGDPAGCSLDDLRIWGGLPPGTKIRRREPVFPRLDVKEALARLNEGRNVIGVSAE